MPIPGSFNYARQKQTFYFKRAMVLVFALPLTLVASAIWNNTLRYMKRTYNI